MTWGGIAAPHISIRKWGLVVARQSARRPLAYESFEF